jgi:hypothetical protein
MADRSGNSGFLARMALFMTLAVVTELWMGHHRGSSLFNPVGLAALIAAVSGVFAWAEKLLDEPEKKSISAGLKRIGRLVFSPVLLVLFCLVVFVMMANYSSLAITPLFSGRSLKVSLTDPGDPNFQCKISPASDGGLVRTDLLRTDPFGHTYQLKVEGYVSAPITVSPLRRVTVVPDRDLRPSPTVMFRPPPLARNSLAKGGRFDVYRIAPGDTLLLATGTGPTAFMVGPPREIPTGASADWRLELESQDIEGLALKRTLFSWMKPGQLSPTVDLEPGWTLRAVVLTNANKLQAEAEIQLGNRSYQDVRMNLQE